MPRFIEKSGAFAISTNLKVMYSTLVSHDHIDEVSESRFARFAWRQDRPSLLLTRDPLARLRSAFKDKCRTQVESLGSERFVGWQRFHRVHYRHLGIRAGDDDGAIQRAFRELSFERFVALLPRTRLLDGHLRPQFLLESIRFKRLMPLFPLRFTRVMRMEAMDAGELTDDWGINTRVRSNQTGSEASRWDDLSPAAVGVISQIYRQDYERYGYDPPGS